MTVVLTGLSAILKRFPDRGDGVKRLFRENESFRTACEDYRKCVEALQHWNQSASDEAPARRDEYAALKRDLEAEILAYLNEPGEDHVP